MNGFERNIGQNSPWESNMARGILPHVHMSFPYIWGMIPLYLNHDSRVRENSEVVMKFTHIYIHINIQRPT